MNLLPNQRKKPEIVEYAPLPPHKSDVERLLAERAMAVAQYEAIRLAVHVGRARGAVSIGEEAIERLNKLDLKITRLLRERQLDEDSFMAAQSARILMGIADGIEMTIHSYMSPTSTMQIPSIAQ